MLDKTQVQYRIQRQSQIKNLFQEFGQMSQMTREMPNQIRAFTYGQNGVHSGSIDGLWKAMQWIMMRCINLHKVTFIFDRRIKVRLRLRNSTHIRQHQDQNDHEIEQLEAQISRMEKTAQEQGPSKHSAKMIYKNMCEEIKRSQMEQLRRALESTIDQLENENRNFKFLLENKSRECEDWRQNYMKVRPSAF